MYKIVKLSILSFFILLAISSRGNTRNVSAIQEYFIEPISTGKMVTNDTTAIRKTSKVVTEKFVYAELVFHAGPGIPEGERWVNCNNMSSESWEQIKQSKTNIEALDIMGELGWELVSVTIRDYNNPYQNYYNLYYFKRKI